MPRLKGKGLGIATAHDFDSEPSSMVHEQLARLEFAKSQLQLQGSRILDFGCGTGYNCFYLAQQVAPRHIVGVDILEDCIEHCRKTYPSPLVVYHVQDCLEFNASLGQFDVVLTCEVIEHVDDQALFLENIDKYLRPGGVAFISTPNRAVFSLTKSRSFLNDTHVRELYFEELNDLLRERFSEVKLYSQVHKEEWHDDYINYLAATNLAHTFRHDIFRVPLFGRLCAALIRSLHVPLRVSKRRRDVSKRRHSDFEFRPGGDSRAVWFVAVCRKGG